MRKFNIKVNGKSYEVEVEEVGGTVSSMPAVKGIPAPADVSVEKAEAPKKEANPVHHPAAASEGGEVISCPMPGTILVVNVKPGDIVKSRDVLFVLEAMKMENEIVAPKDGKVAQVGVTKGASVNTGDMLAVLQ